MLNKQRPDLYTKLNVKRQQHHQFFQALILNCAQPAQVSQCREYLSKFVRTPTTSFSEAVTCFNAVYNFWQQILRPVSKDDLVDMSVQTLRQITPLLLSDKCARLFTSWCEQQSLYQTKITKESILETVQKFEEQAEYQLRDSKKLPHHLGFIETMQPSVQAFKTSVETDAKFTSQVQQFQQQRPRSQSGDRRSHSAGKTGNDRRPSRSQERHESKTPPSNRSSGHVSRQQAKPPPTDRSRIPSGGHNP